MPDDASTTPPDDAARAIAKAPTPPTDTHAPPPETPSPETDDDEWEYVDEDDEDDASPSSEPSRLTELLALSAFCLVIGGMLAGAVLGVLYAPPARTASQPADALPTARARAPSDASSDAPSNAGAMAVRGSDRDADPGTDAAGSSQEADPEIAGDGVMDDLEDGPAEPLPPPPSSPSQAPPTHRPLLLARTARPTLAPSPSPRRVITSDDVPEGPVQGYVDGRPVRIVVTRIDGKPVEVHTAAAYRRMREAARRDGITLRIVSGFRTMEHQQALYRAYRQGRGNLAAMPGHSNHQSGHALDLNTSASGVFRWLTRNAHRFGFRRTVPTEPWHWEWW